MSTGRVLILGARSPGLVARLESRGFECRSSKSPDDALHALSNSRPDAIVISLPARSAVSALKKLRASHSARGVPLLYDGRDVGPELTTKLEVDGVANSLDELERQLLAGVRARRVADGEALIRRRLELLLEMTRASSFHGSGSPLSGLVEMVSQRLRAALACEQVKVLQFEGEGPQKAFLRDETGRTPVDLAFSPTLRRAVERHEPVEGEGTWVFPVPREPRHSVALVFRRALPFEQEERDFITAVAIALSHAFEQLEAQASISKTQSTLEAAYLERFKELQETNQRLKAADRRKTELLAVLSHDLRAPLNVQLGHAYLLLTDRALPTGLKPSAEAIQRSSRKMLELVESLLESSRGQDGKIVLFTKTMDVAETCQEAVNDLQILARERGLALRAEAPMSLEVVGDEQKIRQVLQNLITNALKHASEAKAVVVRARLKPQPDGDVALVEVQDDGVLRDANALLLAFDRSSGLGLSICRDYVERHGGEIWAEAPSTGGALFAFTLPIRHSKPARKPVVTPGAPLVLLAEDDPVFARVCTLGLSGHYRVEVARDGNEAVAKAKALGPDVVVMDVFMPNRDGLDALRELQQTASTANIPVLLISGHPDLSEKLRAMDIGHVETLTKPFSLSHLLTRVGNVLRRSAQEVAAVGVDAETGLFDHLGLANRLEQELFRSSRYGRALCVGVLRPPSSLIDANAIAALAASLRQELRNPDVVGHLGGGVFVFILPETPLEQAQHVAQRLKERLGDRGRAYATQVVDVREGTHSAESVLEQLGTAS